MSISGKPFDDFRNLLDVMPEASEQAVAAVRSRDAQLTKPPGALGRLEQIAEWLAGWQGRHPPQIEHVRVRVFAANHGVARDVVLELMRMESRPDDTAPYLARVHVPVAEMMRAGQRSGEIRTDCDADFLAEMVVGALNAAVTHWLADPDYPIADRLPRAAAFVWEAIRAPGAAR